MEPRAAIASFDAQSQRYTLIAPTQGVAVVRKVLAESVFKVPSSQVRILTHDVGGGFGMKVQIYSEYAALLCAARRVGRPVKWCASRLESFLTDTHGRDGAAGRASLRSMTPESSSACGCAPMSGIGAYTSTYRRDLLDHQYQKLPVERLRHSGDPYRREDGADQCGAARALSRRRRPEAIYLIERLIDRAARAMNIDPAELRRRNLIRAVGDAVHRRRTGRSTTAANSQPILERAQALADWNGFPARRKASERNGKLRGIGIGCFLEVAGGILDETVDLRFEPDGKVALRTGAQAMGQGHLSTFVPLVAQRLGIDPAVRAAR